MLYQELIELLTFENPETIAIATGIIVFIIAFEALSKFTRIEKPILIITSIILGLISSYFIYTNEPTGWSKLLALILIFIIAALGIKICWAFIKAIKTNIAG